MKVIRKKCLKCFFSPNLYCKWIGKCLGRYALLILSYVKTENGFCVLVDVHEMAKIRKILCKQYVSIEKILKSPNILWLFCEL